MKPSITHKDFPNQPAETVEVFKLEEHNFIGKMTRKWNLDPFIVRSADYNFLRHWSAADIKENLASRYDIKIWNVIFRMTMDNFVWEVYNRELKAIESGELPRYMFWISFRSCRFPIGSKTGKLYSYALVQLETRK